MSDVPLRDYVEALLDERDWRRDDQRAADKERFEASVAAVDKARVLQAKEYERALTAYPTVGDFAKLVSRVDSEFASRDGKLKATLFVLAITNALTLGISVWLGWLSYAK